jgi:predicted PurR-regulated permease PerM
LQDFRLITAFLVIPGRRREDRNRPTLSADAAPHSKKEPEHENQHAPLSYDGAWRIVWLVFLLIIIWLILRALQPVIVLFALVFLLAMVLNPIVVWLRKHRVPRLLSVILLMLGLIAVAGTIVVFAIPPLSRQSQELMRNAPRVWQGIRTRIESLTKNYPAVREALLRSDEIAGKVGAAARTVGSILLRSTIGLVGGVASIVFAILLLVFVLANPRPVVAAYLALAPDHYRDQAHRTLARLMRQMTAWARGVVINGVITGVSIGALLWLIGVQPALIFGAFAFLGEFLPNIGAFLVHSHSVGRAERGCDQILARPRRHRIGLPNRIECSCTRRARQRNAIASGQHSILYPRDRDDVRAPRGFSGCARRRVSANRNRRILFAPAGAGLRCN